MKVLNDKMKLEKTKELFIFLAKVNLKPRTETFVLSLEEWFFAKGKLTDKQFEALCDVYENLS